MHFNLITLKDFVLDPSLVEIIALLFVVALLFCLVYITTNPVGFFLRKKLTIKISKGNNTCKINTNILFIDDREIPVASTLRDDGWHVEILRDADIDHNLVKKSDIIFVDWKGVGRKISQETQGIALAEALKRKYRHKKYIILYSAREFTKPDGAVCDDWINKGSEFSQYMDTIYKACHVLCK